MGSFLNLLLFNCSLVDFRISILKNDKKDQRLGMYRAEIILAKKDWNLIRQVVGL